MNRRFLCGVEKDKAVLTCSRFRSKVPRFDPPEIYPIRGRGGEGEERDAWQ